MSDCSRSKTYYLNQYSCNQLFDIKKIRNTLPETIKFQ